MDGTGTASCQCSSVPVRRRPRRIALKTCANEVSGDFRFCILEHSLAQRVFQPVPAFQQGVRPGGERDDDGCDQDAGAGLGHTSSVELQREAQCVWQRRDFLRRECLRPGGLLYMNAVDSFGAQLRTDRVYHFPHFGPIKDDQFRYNAEHDCLVAEQDVQSEFIRNGTINAHSRCSGGSQAGEGGESQPGSGVLTGNAPSTEETDGERAARVRAARLARLGQ